MKYVGTPHGTAGHGVSLLSGVENRLVLQHRLRSPLFGIIDALSSLRHFSKVHKQVRLDSASFLELLELRLSKLFIQPALVLSFSLVLEIFKVLYRHWQLAIEHFL